jgi:hypothetical protein
MQIINVADLKDPNDPQGRSYREVNAAQQHKYPVGTLVEKEDGCRAWVVKHSRDCDRTPLYVLSLEKDDTEPRYDSIGLANHGWSGGWSEESLTPVVPNAPVERRAPSTFAPTTVSETESQKGNKCT